ncbi:uncharacterized protein [Panulirus ornatus]|uniref:uncharacterized protein n=1 Tax=Panulirus ornatus TaxID=150431 RepID=UPI003A8ABC43
MKLLLLTLMAAAANAGPSYTRVFTEQNQVGNYADFNDYVPNLSLVGFDNTIDSVIQTGMWMYYDNQNYNIVSGKVYWVHGIDIHVNFPTEYTNMCTSLRYAGSPNYLNEDTWTMYEGSYFTGVEYYGNGESSNFGPITGSVSSFILTGLSPWTIYSGENWSGDTMCVYPNTDHDVGSNGATIDFGIFPEVSPFVGIWGPVVEPRVLWECLGSCGSVWGPVGVYVFLW